jgi:hypothetical protein
LAAGFAAAFFGAAFLAAGFAAAFFGAAFFAAGFAAAFFGAAFFAAGLAAVVFLAAAGFLAFFSSAIVNLHCMFEERETNNPPTTARIIQQRRRTGLDELRGFHGPSFDFPEGTKAQNGRREGAAPRRMASNGEAGMQRSDGDSDQSVDQIHLYAPCLCPHAPSKFAV